MIFFIRYLLGLLTGPMKKEAEIQVLCYNVIEELLRVCTDNRKPLQIAELHLVNLYPEISLHLKVAFTRFSSGIEGCQTVPSFSKALQRRCAIGSRTSENRSLVGCGKKSENNQTKHENNDTKASIDKDMNRSSGKELMKATRGTLSVPLGVIDALKKKAGGINPIIDEMRTNHLIDINFDGRELQISGLHDEILYLANDYLHWKAGKAQISNITLGGNGTVEWRFNNAKHIQHLFDTEFESLLESKFVTKTVRGEDIIFSCKYSKYKSTKSLLEDVETEIKRYKGKQLK
jgi:hypothetical protein